MRPHRDALISFSTVGTVCHKGQCNLTGLLYIGESDFNKSLSKVRNSDIGTLLNDSNGRPLDQ